MTFEMNEAGYEQTKSKLAGMEVRLRALEARTDVPDALKSEACRSYKEMMRQYAREIKLYEKMNAFDAEHPTLSHEPS